ncbi:MAG TPA: hypothetical protein VK722_10500 [Candidatus Aquilonibacter sp.]|nr:hypothetical protein [Verrucomicrobiae bacterium]HTC47742.1 hypothetical protein [Candidatus Aquilonibacter sp.]
MAALGVILSNFQFVSWANFLSDYTLTKQILLRHSHLANFDDQRQGMSGGKAGIHQVVIAPAAE